MILRILTCSNTSFIVEATKYLLRISLARQNKSILAVNWRHTRLIDLVSAKGKTKVSWLISFHSLIRQCFNILIRHCNPSRIRNIKIEWSKQLYHNNTLPLFSTLPKLGQWMWRQLTERIGKHSQNFSTHNKSNLLHHCWIIPSIGQEFFPLLPQFSYICLMSTESVQ